MTSSQVVPSNHVTVSPEDFERIVRKGCSYFFRELLCARAANHHIGRGPMAHYSVLRIAEDLNEDPRQVRVVLRELGFRNLPLGTKLFRLHRNETREERRVKDRRSRTP